ncbi:MAG: hypothetical protein AAFR84_19390 [Pseudomonadota bacterium]
MIDFRPLDDDHPALAGSRLLEALRYMLAHGIEENGLGLTKTKALNRKVVGWAAEAFDWPGYRAEELLQVSKVLNQDDVLPVLAIHDLLIVMKLGRHRKDRLLITPEGRRLADRPGALFTVLTPNWLFRYNHARLSRFEETAPGNWDVFLNVINVEAESAISRSALTKILYGPADPTVALDRTHAGYETVLFSHVLRPLTWLGLLEETRDGPGLLAERFYTKSPLWRACLTLPTDGEVRAPILN